MSDTPADPTVSRRKALSRIGGLAFAAYTVPAFTTLSVAHAASSASAASEASEASEASAASEPSAASVPSTASTPSTASASSASSGPSASGSSHGSKGECEAIGVDGDWNDATGTCSL